MQVNLRKANAIQTEIKTAISEMQIETQVTITEFESPAEVMEKARERGAKVKAARSSLNDALFEIRKKTAQANTSSGISDALTDINQLEAQISMLRPTAAPAALAMNEKVMEGRLKKLKETPTDQHYYPGQSQSGVTTGLFSEEEIEVAGQEISKLKRQKKDLQDKLLGLNVATEIELSEKAVKALEEAGII